MLNRIKRSAFGKKYLEQGALINFLKRVKHFGGRVYRKLRGKAGVLKHKRYDKLLPLVKENFQEDCDPQAGKDLGEQAEVDVIVPIYNGYEYLERLFEGLLRAGMDCRIILVDDRSIDERVKGLEQEFAASQDNVLLLENEENYGFVKSVNRGLAAAVHHVALVNTDTELPEGWLERLMYPIFHLEKVASTTPYTNSGTIFSFPGFCYNNRIYRGKSAEELDRHFRKLKPRYVSVPTGVGFCMGMSRQALDDVGELDYETFDRGFGEENDWCQRAIQKGYRNVQVENLFVYHKHGGSFRSDEKERLIQTHLERLKDRFPDYDRQVSAFIRKDPNRQLRQLVQMLIDTNEQRSILYFDHSLGGGATGYLERQKAKFLQEGCCVSVIRYAYQTFNYRYFFDNGREQLIYEVDYLPELLEIGKWFHYDEIYVNELATYPHLWEAQGWILQLKQQQKSPLVMLCHDFFALCPTINLLNTSRRYCGIPGGEACESCYLQKGFDGQYSCGSYPEYVAHWKDFLGQCDEVRAFSQDTADKFRKVFGEGLRLTLVPHQVNYMFPIEKRTKTTDSLNIGLLGVLTVHKGGLLIEGMLKEIERKGMNIRIKLIGSTDGIALDKHGAFSQTGAYQAAELPRLVYEQDIDLFFLSSIWPETFSYTTEEIIKMGMPVASFDLGAPAERVRRYEKGLILHASREKNEPEEGGALGQVDAVYVLQQLQNFAARHNLTWNPKPGGRANVRPKKVLYLAEYISFSSRYRLEHFQEELLYQGIPGELWETKELPRQVDWENIAAVVVYRCRLQGELKPFLEEAGRRGIRRIYDIDDYIFHYEAIRDFSILDPEYYGNVEEYSNGLLECMKLCNGITVSTDHMKQAVEAVLPGKSVFVNRNVASAEMLILSAQAQEQAIRETDRIVLGYFSGSNTHNGDFALIEEVLAELMGKYPGLYLKIVGCLEMPKKFRGLEERVITQGFMEWQKLPEAIAETDINLMPLEDTFFHWCKSENKWMEAALVKVPTVGSYNEEIAGATRSGENVMLCKSAEEWRENLERLILDEGLRKELGQKAWEYVSRYKTTLYKHTDLLHFVMEK